MKIRILFRLHGSNVCAEEARATHLPSLFSLYKSLRLTELTAVTRCSRILPHWRMTMRDFLLTMDRYFIWYPSECIHHYISVSFPQMTRYKQQVDVEEDVSSMGSVRTEDLSSGPTRIRYHMVRRVAANIIMLRQLSWMSEFMPQGVNYEADIYVFQCLPCILATV